ncbi:hypothetical protein MKZ08_00815 [Viridibacillus sp. FSL R5-0477]|uniref:Uncharacterized protein n=1 Tax=Viridibacillus arenosi FSL R5-213 TaxID=1227360 RepID=W4ES12_9BACL|nr:MULTISPECIES: hypothetical protein [Viridibacillus]ETT83054.1 hypothetical protein C176_14132 [Viridibacillus arenosi FSL R5-213]
MIANCSALPVWKFTSPLKPFKSPVPEPITTLRFDVSTPFSNLPTCSNTKVPERSPKLPVNCS